MIIYHREGWWSLILRFRGTVWPSIWKRALFICIYTNLAYAWCCAHEQNLGEMRPNILGSTLSFLLVFRANNAYWRYSKGRTTLTSFFSQLRNICDTSVMFMRGGRRNHAWRVRRHHLNWSQASDTGHRTQAAGTRNQRTSPVAGHMPPADVADQITSEERTHIIRWALVVAISLQLHTRILFGLCNGMITVDTKWLIDFDRYRIRHLTTAVEFEELDKYVRSLTTQDGQAELWDKVPVGQLGVAKELMAREPPHLNLFFSAPNVDIDASPGVRMHLAAAFRFSEAIGRAMNDLRLQHKPYGYAERCLPIFMAQVQQVLQDITRITQGMSQPLPFPYFHLLTLLLSIYFAMFPYFIQYELGFWANVGELSTLAVALLGIESIATELEDPFGNDDNDLDIYAEIAELERSSTALLEFFGDTASRENFCWVDMPPNIAQRSHVNLSSFLALKEQVQSEGSSDSATCGKHISSAMVGALAEQFAKEQPIVYDESKSDESDV